MYIGIARFELFIPASRSLKDKRQVLRSLFQTVRNRFNVAVAEVGFQDKWQRASVGITCVSGSTRHCRAMLEEVERAVVRAVVPSAEVVDRDLQVVALEDL